jgi:predicted AlkP superfamily phosphohydrolase/phosphomutase
MLSGRDPGELGLYGFRKRTAGSYDLSIVESSDVRAPLIWERVAAAGKRAVALFVPPSYPPRPFDGELVSCFLTPDGDDVHTHPATLGDELRARFGPYRPDVSEYRTDALGPLLDELYALSAQHFAIAEHMWRTRSPELLVMVDIGIDRFHHAFWKHLDVPGDPHADAGRAYYGFLDAQIGKLLAAVGDDTAVLVVSDHGARTLAGGICVNEWLIRHGYLVLHDYPGEITPPGKLRIDWSRTRAWAEGGYYARVFVNVAGREPEGCVQPGDVTSLVAELAQGLGEISGPKGEHLTHRIVTAQQSYRRTEGLPPELCVFFGDLDYRAIGSVGHRSLYAAGNDTGPDGCNHDWDGIFVMRVPGEAARGELAGLQIYDVNATLLALMGLPTTEDLLGCDVRARLQTPERSTP